MIKRHYPYVTRKLLELREEGMLPNVAGIEVEPEYGYVTRVRYTNGAVRLTRGNDVGLNSGAACEVVKDKAHTKFFLRGSGYRCPRGQTFLLPWWAEQIMPGLGTRGFSGPRTTAGAAAYAGEIGFPVYVKPVDGSKGLGVFRCDGPGEVDEVMARYAEQRVRVAVVEEAVGLPDHRLVVLRGKLISAYSRYPLAVVGDGSASIGELLVRLQRHFEDIGRDTRIDLADVRIGRRLARSGRTLRSVPAAGEHVVLHDISNLSAGGSALDVTAEVSRRWTDLALDVSASLGLDFSGVDLACADLSSPDGDYAILEVNATPGLDHYGSVGTEQEKIVKAMYAVVLNEPA
ncbi:hypothetical protein [Actinocorallia longicatena]|uniref:ATP-grasp domain-containing protein n=1 Tax=Actinocorallia longicatena TaxID=111803 RepID=A0ABP6QFR0_9ACTN